MKKLKIDIVGGSLAGLSAAISLKELNKKIDVNVYEKHKEIGYNSEGRRCGEAHSIEREWSKWIPDKKSVYNYIYNVETIIGNKVYTIKRKHGVSCILNRQEFIAQLGRQAEKLKVNIHTNCKIKRIKDFDSDYIIDASGCPSSVKKELNIKHRKVGKTYQETLENSNYFFKDAIKIFASEKTGYFWVFPRNKSKKEINLGVGFLGKKSVDLKKILQDFKDKHKIQGEVNYVTGGLIPVGLQKPLKHDNIIFVGDAGVGTFPYSGEGIYRALYSGELAAKSIASNKPEKYQYDIQRYFFKWDSIGHIVVKMSALLNNIGPNAVLSMYSMYYRLIV